MKQIKVTERQIKVIGESILNEDKKMTVHYHKAQGNSKDVPLYDNTYDKGDAVKRTNLNTFFSTEGKIGLDRLISGKLALEDINGNKYYMQSYKILGNKGIKVDVMPADYSEQSQGRSFMGSNIFIQL